MVALIASVLLVIDVAVMLYLHDISHLSLVVPR